MNTKQPVSEHIVKEFKKRFGFIFERGYTIHSARTINDPDERYEGREVTAIRGNFRIKFVEQIGIAILFGTSSKGFKNIRSLIYYLSGETEFIEDELFDLFFQSSSKKKAANYLQKYIDKFEGLYGIDFPLYKDAIEAADKRFLERVKQSFALPATQSAQAPKKYSFAEVTFLFIVYLIGAAFLLGLVFNISSLTIIPETIRAIAWAVLSILLAMNAVKLFIKRER